jgi:hypothetical protein
MKRSVVLLALLASACAPSSVKVHDAKPVGGQVLENVWVSDVQAYYRWCDGKHLLFSTGFDSRGTITVVPNDPRCAAEAAP